MIDAETVKVLAELSDNGFWAVFWWAAFNALPNTLFVILCAWWSRVLWRKCNSAQHGS